jgi:hypothetical protein
VTTAAAREPIEADVMREYDEHIRLYTPMLQRVIILVAVIIAVPVVLWTITAFVRAYVAPPQLPTFKPLAAAQTTNTATDARTPLLAIKKPSDAPQAAPAMPPAQQAAAPVPPPPVSATPADAVPAPASPLAGRGSVPPPPFAATRSTPSTVAAPVMAAPAMAAPPAAAPANVALASNAAGQAATPPAPNAMPGVMPNAMPMPANSVANNQPADAAPFQQQSAASDSADDVPAGTPLHGKIPLPTRRPHIAGLTNVAANVAANVAVADGAVAMSPGMTSRVPLPRARPTAAPEPVSEPIPAYDPSQIH